MNMNVLALMCAIAIAFLGGLVYAVQSDHPLLLLALVCAGAIAFAPWHRLR